MGSEMCIRDSLMYGFVVCLAHLTSGWSILLQKKMLFYLIDSRVNSHDVLSQDQVQRLLLHLGHAELMPCGNATAVAKIKGCWVRTQNPSTLRRTLQFHGEPFNSAVYTFITFASARCVRRRRKSTTTRGSPLLGVAASPKRSCVSSWTTLSRCGKLARRHFLSTGRTLAATRTTRRP